MAKYTVTRACGHEEVVVLVGKMKDRDWRLENVEPSKLCHGCYLQKLAEERKKENQEAAEAAKEMNLPQLTGTEKQAAWAETIRQRLLTDIDEFIFRGSKRSELQRRVAAEYIKGKTEARWWIDNRDAEINYLLAVADKEVKKEITAPPPEIVADAKAEATVRPENPVTETVAEIRVLENAVEIDFPEKRDDFREVVKKQLKMEWAGKRWVRSLIAKNGTPVDRAAEAGHRLLAEGFIIRIYDEGIRRRAISGDYEPECTRWIQKRTSGEYGGWFAVTWDRGDDFYKAARSISGSRWSKPSVVVPPENYEEVLDFAEMYGFKLSEMAREVAELARLTKERALVAHVDAPEAGQKVVTTGRPPVLEVPVEVGVDDEFKD